MGSFLDKGIIFCGCSFTWGQGLWHYSDLKNIHRPKVCNSFEFKQITGGHFKYAQKNRFARLVANHFDTFDVVKNANGGSEENSLGFLNNLFNTREERLGEYGYEIENTFIRYHFDDIEYIVYQFSQPIRNGFQFEINTADYSMNEIREINPYLSADNPFIHNFDVYKSKPKLILRYSDAWFNMEKEKTIHKMFLDYLQKNNLDMKTWYETVQVPEILDMVKKELQFYESKGIKIKLLFWENESFVNHFKKDEWISSNLVKLNYKGIEYETIQSIIWENEKDGMTIDCDTNQKIQDHHPSQRLHNIIANSIIKSIENELV